MSSRYERYGKINADRRNKEYTKNNIKKYKMRSRLERYEKINAGRRNEEYTKTNIKKYKRSNILDNFLNYIIVLGFALVVCSIVNEIIKNIYTYFY